MAMVSIKGILTEDGKIEVELPEGWQAGEIRVEVQIEPAWTDEEIDDILQFKGKALGDIDPNLIGAGADWDIGDSAEWVQQKRNERRSNWTD